MWTFATWNIQKGFGVDLRRDLARTRDVLAGLDADVVALQEVCRTSANDQAAWLANELGMELAWGPARALGEGSYGNALLVRGRIESHTVHELGLPGRERRSCLEAVLVVPSLVVPTHALRVRVFACHLGLGGRERAQQIARVLAHVDDAPRTEPRLVLGDFNEWRADGPVRRGLARVFPASPAPLRTHPSPWPLFALDRIAWDASLEGTLSVRPVRRASDHRALRAELSVRG